MKRYITILVVGFLFLGLGITNLFPQVYSENQKQKIFTDANTTPREFHKMMSELKQKRIDKLQQLGKRIRPQGSPGQNDYDAKYYKLDLNLNDTTEIISGSVYIYASALIDGFNLVELNFFDNPQMYVDSIKSNGTLLSFSWSNDIISVTLNQTYNREPFDMIVYYHGHPLEGGLQSFDWGYHGDPSTPIMCTLSEPYFAQAWWPCKDLPKDKADSADINVTVRSDLYVASNGLLKEIIDHGSTKTYKWHEKYPITTYLISIAATNYSIFSNWYRPISMGIDSMEVIYYVYPERLSDAQGLYPITPSMIDFFANLFGEYPFVEEKYGMAHFTFGGAMEHQTCSSFSSTWYSLWVVAHELAHQWWGDYITIHNWHHIWLNEGFASYCEALWAEYDYGKSYYHTYMDYMEYLDEGTIFVEDTTDAWNIFSWIVYDKGAWVLHMLRHVVGDSTFFDILRTYYSEYAHGFAVTEDFQDICETESGMDLNYFFQQWIYGTFYPMYSYSWIYESAGSGYYDVYLHLDQEQVTSPTHFTMPVDITITAGGDDTTFVVFNDQEHKDFQLRVYGTPSDLQVDKEKWILRSTSSTTYDINIITTDLPNGSQYLYYSDTLKAKGGTAPYKWNLKSGSLPDSIQMDSLTGIISGIPTEIDTANFIVKVTDSSNPQKIDTQVLNIVVEEGAFTHGDANSTGDITISDVIYIISYLFKGGPSPVPLLAGDADCDSEVKIEDVIYLINYLFKGGPPIPC